MPAQVAPVRTETEALAGYLAQQQEAFRAVAHGLTDRQAAEANTISALTVGGLIKHVTETQQSWLDLVLAAPGSPANPDEADVAAYGDSFGYDPAYGLAATFADFDRVSAAVIDAVETIDLDTAVPVPDAPWNPKDIDAWSVRWVWFHLFEELTRHAGHADIVREAIDGATMYALIAGREGWPATPWLTPWGSEPVTA